MKSVSPYRDIPNSQRRIGVAEGLRQLARGRIGIIITHRFTTAMFADVIHVMSAGRIVESGSHEELLAAGGLYAQGWAAQARV